MRVASLHIYPVKSAYGIGVNEAELRPRGLRYDRRWMVVDHDGGFLTQRTHPLLATISVALLGGERAGVRLTAGGGVVDVMEPESDARRCKVTVWRCEVDAADAGDEVAAWLEKVLGVPARLVFMDDDALRETPKEWGGRRPTSFADGFPLLVTTTASLAALNDAIASVGGQDVAMGRFRPNIVIESDTPWTEDAWERLRIGACEIALVKPCTRCVVTTLDPATGASLGKEPLATLARLRRSGDKRAPGVLFGWNAVPIKTGRIAVGDPVEVLAARPNTWPLATV